MEAKADGHVVLLDTFYPGWHAEVDGREQPIRAADLAFRAVAVTPGRHTVRFFYRPTSVIAGGGLSLAALLVIVVCLIGLRRRGGSDRAASRYGRLQMPQRAHQPAASPAPPIPPPRR